ncbi:uncharacterized protein [Onthophagus taurus]|uniref:uncharacterized protein n=1 Tax=Onthophagus taurus TaxID=166361 RepID=UPI0039BE858E
MSKIKMLSFTKNKCRFCIKVFCCEKCRQKHELKIHDIYPNCDICAYGSIVLKLPTDDLLNHIKEKHWPLHCVDCNRIFGAVHELILHNKCPLAKIEETPLNYDADTNGKIVNFDSGSIEIPFKNITPSGGEIFDYSKMGYLTTSTPRAVSDKVMNIFESVTTSEIKSKTDEDFVSNATTDDVKVKRSTRTVTFNETPTYESLRKTPQEQTSLKSSLKKTSFTKTPEKLEIENVSNDIQTPQNCPTIWETATETPTQDELEIENSFDTMFDSCVSSIQIEDITFEEITKNNIQVLKEAQNIFQKSQHISIWTSMTCLVKNFVSGLSSSSQDLNKDCLQLETPRSNAKKRRIQDDTTFEENEKFEKLKKMKLTDIKCRKPINNTIPYLFIRKEKPSCDKSTQTDLD